MSSVDKALNEAEGVRNIAVSPVERVADAIMDGIRRGVYVPGQRLIEAELMDAYDASRGHVREALRLLAGDGIIELVPRKGARVRKLARQDVAKLMPVLSGLLQTTIRLGIGRLAAPEFVSGLEQAMSAMRQARTLEDFQQFQLAAMRYTAVLMEAADNPYLDYLHGKLHPHLFHHQVAQNIGVVDWDSYLDHFECVHDACLALDADTAIELIRQHEDEMLEMLEQDDNPAASQ